MSQKHTMQVTFDLDANGATVATETLTLTPFLSDTTPDGFAWTLAQRSDGWVAWSVRGASFVAAGAARTLSAARDEMCAEIKGRRI